MVPIWFHWTGNEIVLGTAPTAPKLKVLRNNSPVALTKDSNDWPYKVLEIRGKTQIQTVHGVVPEYAAAAERYFGTEQGKTWVAQGNPWVSTDTSTEYQDGPLVANPKTDALGLVYTCGDGSSVCFHTAAGSFGAGASAGPSLSK